MRQHPENLPVVAVDTETDEIVARSQLGPYDQFELEVPHEHAAVEVRVALPGVAPAVVELATCAEAIEVVLYFDNNHNSRF